MIPSACWWERVSTATNKFQSMVDIAKFNTSIEQKYIMLPNQNIIKRVNHFTSVHPWVFRTHFSNCFSAPSGFSIIGAELLSKSATLT